MLKYCLGIDVSSKDFHCCLSAIDGSQKVTVKASRKFTNNKEGFKELRQWTEQHHKDRTVPLTIVMEATGIYYEKLAFYLFKAGYAVSVILPNKAKRYLQSTGIKSKNDKIDAQGLSRMGSEQRLDTWQPINEFFYGLRALTRQHQSLQELKTNVSNQLLASELSMYPNKLVTKQQKQLLKALEKQITSMEDVIQKYIAQNEEVKQKADNICKIKGLGLRTIAVILAEINGFTLFENSRQVISYAGYDVVENQSGNRTGRTRISKKGNSRIRRVLHLPAFNMIRYQQTPFIALFNRTLDKHGQKMKSYVAVQKKLLAIIYALWKYNTPYQLNYSKTSLLERGKRCLPLCSARQSRVE